MSLIAPRLVYLLRSKLRKNKKPYFYLSECQRIICLSGQTLNALEFTLFSRVSHFLLRILKFQSDTIIHFYRSCVRCSYLKLKRIAKASKHTFPFVYTQTLVVDCHYGPQVHGEWGPVTLVTSVNLCWSNVKPFHLTPPATILTQLQPRHETVSDKRGPSKLNRDGMRTTI